MTTYNFIKNNLKVRNFIRTKKLKEIRYDYLKSFYENNSFNIFGQW